MAGLHEVDVVGLRFRDHAASLCEVTTHLEGLLYGKGWKDTVDRIWRKHQHQRHQGGAHGGLAAIDGLELVINEEYKHRVDFLLEKAKKEQPRDYGA